MLRHINIVLVTSSQNVERSVTTYLELLGSHQSTHTGVLHLCLELLAFIIGVKVLVYDIESGSSVIFLASIVLNFSCQDGMLVVFALL